MLLAFGDNIDWAPYEERELTRYTVNTILSYEDLKEDQRAGRYNPLKQLSEKEDYEERMRDILCMMMGECSAEFEKLPCLLDTDILRNILYDGVWNRYRSIQEKEKETDRREDEKTMTKNPYDVLGVSPNASDDEVKRAYRDLSRSTIRMPM